MAGRYPNKNVRVLRPDKPAGVVHIVIIVLTAENRVATAPAPAPVTITKGKVVIGLEKKVVMIAQRIRSSPEKKAVMIAQRVRSSPGHKAAGVTVDPGTDDHVDEDRVVDRVPTDVAQIRSVRAIQMSVTQRMWMSITVNNRVLASNRDHIQINLTGEVINLNLNHPRKFNLHLRKLNQSRPK